MRIPERSTAALTLTFRDEDGTLVLVGAITAIKVSIFGRDETALFTLTDLPTDNPQLYVLDLTSYDIDAVGSTITAEWEVTYNSLSLGNGAIMRGTEKARFVNSRI